MAETTAPAATIYRVKYVYDEDHQFEECNGERRPLTEAEYAENQYMACPDHPQGDKSGDTSDNGRGTCGRCGKAYAPIPYEEYLAYYGNPERHVYVGCVLQQQCACCGSWTEAGSLWGIDCMDDDTDLQLITFDKAMPYERAAALPGYLGEVARELWAEAQKGGQ